MDQNKEMNRIEEDDEEYETPAQKQVRKRKGYEIGAAVVSVILLIVAFAFPLIICDILSTTSIFFRTVSGVGIYSEYSDSTAQFFFGLGFTFRHIEEGFVPMQLFTAQWKIIGGVTDATVTSGGFTFLGAITMILTILIFVTPFIMIVLYMLDRFTNINIVRKIVKYVSVTLAGIEAFTVLWFFAIIVGLASKMGMTLGAYRFNSMDFLAYGAVKLILEAVFCLGLGYINLRLFLNLKNGVPEQKELINQIT